jgi:hypothetical protein
MGVLGVIETEIVTKAASGNSAALLNPGYSLIALYPQFIGTLSVLRHHHPTKGHFVYLMHKIVISDSKYPIEGRFVYSTNRQPNGFDRH